MMTFDGSMGLVVETESEVTGQLRPLVLQYSSQDQIRKQQQTAPYERIQSVVMVPLEETIEFGLEHNKHPMATKLSCASKNMIQTKFMSKIHQEEEDDSNICNSDNNNNDKYPHNDDGRNLDSNYAWLILAIMVLLNASSSGSVRLLGLVYAEQVSSGYYDRQQASWPITTSSTIENLAGLLTPALANYLSWQQLELLSTSLFVASNLALYFSDSLVLDIIFLGCFQGIALSINTILCLAIINDYFDKYRTTAYGIALSGSTLGVIILGPFVTWIIENKQNFRLVYLNLAWIYLLNIPLLIFIKQRNQLNYKLTKTKKTTGKQAIKEHKSTSLEQSLPNEPHTVKGSFSTIDKFMVFVGEDPFILLDQQNKERKNSIASMALELKQRRISAWSRRDVPELQRNIKGQQQQQQQQQQQHQGLFKPLGQSFSFTNSNNLPIGQCNQQQSISSSNNNNTRAAKHKISVHSICFGSLGDKRLSIVGKTKLDKSKQQQQQQQQTRISTISYGWATDGPLDSIDSISESNKIAQVVNLQATHSSRQVTHNTNCTEPLGQFQEAKRGVSRDDDDDDDVIRQQRYESGTNIEETTTTPAPPLHSTLLLLVQKPQFHLVWFMLTLYYLISRTFIMILADFGQDHGLSLNEASGLANYWSIGELCGRTLLASLIDLRWLSIINCTTICCTSLAGSILLMALWWGEEISLLLMIYSFSSILIAALCSLEYLLINVVIFEYFGANQLTSCYSLASFVSAIILFGRPALIGLFRDQFNSYKGLLIFLAILSFVLALISAIQSLFTKKQKSPPSTPPI